MRTTGRFIAFALVSRFRLNKGSEVSHGYKGLISPCYESAFKRPLEVIGISEAMNSVLCYVLYAERWPLDG